MSPLFSVVVPAYDAESTIGACLAALRAMRVPAGGFETIVVDDGSRDATAAVAERYDVRVVRRENGGAAAARNTGIHEARGTWIAFVDSDCIPARGWLAALASALTAPGPVPLGAAGATIGMPGGSPVARFVDLSGGLDASRHLAHPRWPFPPSGNVAYRRDALLAVGGFDERFRTYEACDLHDRLRKDGDAPFPFVARAVVLHKHRASWPAYWRQQVGYGIGYAQFFRSRATEIPWGTAHEVRAWTHLARLGIAAALPLGDADARLLRRGTFVKHLAQRIGFVRTYWNRVERRRWSAPHALG